MASTTPPGGVTNEEQTMSTSQAVIVVGVDGSQSAAQALDWAIDHAVAEHRALTLVHALGYPPAVWTDVGLVDSSAVFKALELEGQQILDHASDRVAERAGAVPVETVREFTDARSLLVRESERAALVVLGSRGRGPVRSLLLGSVGAAVARHAMCPVVIHRPSHRGQVCNGVLVATDASEESQPVLEFAYHVASVRRLPLTIMHCQWDVAGMGLGEQDVPTASLETERLELAVSVAGMGEKYPDVSVTTTLVLGPPEARVVQAVEKMDLLVVGAHRRSTVGRVIHGSVSMSLLEHAQVPVAVVPLATGS
jgi:nucleotide-binding universal stress UspA family protein